MATQKEKMYMCENGHIHTFQELKQEFDFGYDQSYCPICNDVMFDNLHGIQHCETVTTQSANHLNK